MKQLRDFHHEMLQDIQIHADVNGVFSEDAFFELLCEQLIEFGELQTADRTYYSTRGMRIDGYGGDPIEDNQVLNLIVSDFKPSEDIVTLTATEMGQIFQRAMSFLEHALDPKFRQSLEETSPAFGVADLIAGRWSKLEKIRFFIISNRSLSSRVDGRPAGEYQGIPVTYSVWDLNRFYRAATIGHGRDPIDIELPSEFGEPIPLLPAHPGGAVREAYLAVIPGDQLAAIYDRWGVRLLEQNVRVFLQAHGTVNRGIRSTIENEPEMFFAYNNGITATAESVDTQDVNGRLLLTRVQNLQIVNGGQTTASIHAAARKGDEGVSKLFVQMKLSIVDPSTAIEVVPRISQYANSQNRVSPADFFSNHPFHVRLEEFSRRIWAPASEGSFVESKWFYERARGQYQNELKLLAATTARKFRAEFPKKQVITKTDLAKFLQVWESMPHIVSRGAQKNFIQFAEHVTRIWKSQETDISEAYYRHAIAKAIVFRSAERLVSEQPWYSGGYRANVVAYAIAKLSDDLSKQHRSVDFERIWRSQAISNALHDALVISAEYVHRVIIDPPAGTANVTEWAKRPECWLRVRDVVVPWPSAWLDELISIEDVAEQKKAGSKDQKLLNGIEAQTAVFKAGGSFWAQVLQWGQENGLLSSKDVSILKAASAIPSKLPTEKQSVHIVQLLSRLQAEGCALKLNDAS